MRAGIRPEQRVPARSLGLCLLAILSLSAPGLADGGSSPRRVSERAGTRLDSLHQLAASGSTLHLAHARLGEGSKLDRVVVQRSRDGGSDWTKEHPLFTSGTGYTQVLPNLAVASRGQVVAVAYRVQGPRRHDALRPHEPRRGPAVRLADRGRIAVGQAGARRPGGRGRRRRRGGRMDGPTGRVDHAPAQPQRRTVLLTRVPTRVARASPSNAGGGSPTASWASWPRATASTSPGRTRASVPAWRGASSCVPRPTVAAAGARNAP